jgi:hypothetical protein
MILKLKLSVFVLIVGLFSVTVSTARAIEDTATVEQEATTQVDQETVKIQDATVDAESQTNKKSSVEERVKVYKEKQAGKLAEAQSKRIIARCKKAQIKVLELQERVKKNVETRTATYDKIDERITKLSERLQKAGINTSALETAREDVKVDLASLKNSMNDFVVVLSDVAGMDCESDPEAFSAALAAARETRKELLQKSQEFRVFATVQLKTILVDARSQLEALKAAETQTEDTTGGTE